MQKVAEEKATGTIGYDVDALAPSGMGVMDESIEGFENVWIGERLTPVVGECKECLSRNAPKSTDEMLHKRAPLMSGIEWIRI